MRYPIRLGVPVFLAAVALLVSTLGVARAGTEPGGDVTFRLTLRGDVAEGDGFSLGVTADNGVIISPGIRCGPGSELYTPEFTPCAEASYDFVVQGGDSLPVGTELTYAWARIQGPGDDTVIHTDTVTITENAQVLTVVYEYGGRTLPDTAIASPGFPVALGIALVVTSVLVSARPRFQRFRGP